MPTGSNFTEAQIVEIIDSYDTGASLHDLCMIHNISARTLYRWRAQRGRDRDALRDRLKELVAENKRLRLMLASAGGFVVGS